MALTSTKSCHSGTVLLLHVLTLQNFDRLIKEGVKDGTISVTENKIETDKTFDLLYNKSPSVIKIIKSTAMKKLILFVSTTLLALTISAQTLVKGGQFKDRILPMQGSVTKSDGQTIWGASGVQERFLDNGAEPKNSSIFTIIRDGENNRNYIYTLQARRL